MALRWRQDRKRRAARQELAGKRTDLLGQQGIDRRLVEAVWGERYGVLDDLLPAELTDVDWLDDIAIDQPGVVPVFTLIPEEQGVVAVNGWLLQLVPQLPPVQRDLLWVWQRLLGGPVLTLLRHELDGTLDRVPNGLCRGTQLDADLLAFEAERLRGPILGRWLHAVVEVARTEGSLVLEGPSIDARIS